MGHLHAYSHAHIDTHSYTHIHTGKSTPGKAAGVNGRDPDVPGFHDSPDDCIDICLAGNSGYWGVEPCSECDSGLFSPEDGACHSYPGLMFCVGL